MLSGSCLLMAAIFGHDPNLMLLFSPVEKFLNLWSFSILYQLAVEVYSTQLRNQELSLSANISNLESGALPVLFLCYSFAHHRSSVRCFECKFNVHTRNIEWKSSANHWRYGLQLFNSLKTFLLFICKKPSLSFITQKYSLPLPPPPVKD